MPLSANQTLRTSEANEDAQIGRSLIDIGTRECRWPINDAAIGKSHLFCGSRKERGKPYCAAHCRLAYRPIGVVKVNHEVLP